jgi:hypothetical protein
MDMKKGGHNAVCALDPVHLPQPMVMLPHFYTGGWCATIDLLKFFHMFKNVKEERPYFGMIHPVKALEY